MTMTNLISTALADARMKVSTSVKRFLSQNKPEEIVKRKRAVRRQIKRRVHRITLSIDSYKQAIKAAKNPKKPRRFLLQALYEIALDDLHIISQVDIRKDKVLEEEYSIFTNGVLNKEKTKWIKKPWFRKLQRAWLETYLHGHTLIEFDAATKNDANKNIRKGEFTDASVIWRDCVVPETGEIMLRPGQSKGLPYRKEPWSKILPLLEFGENNDLGLLKKIVRSYLRKDDSESAWSEHIDEFAAPSIWAESETDDEEQLDQLEEFLANFGSNKYGISQEGTSIKLIEENKQNPSLMYKDMLKYQDDAVSKGILGGTGLSDMKAWVGAVEAVERAMFRKAFSDMRDMTEDFNHKLLPFMNRFSAYNFVTGDEFKFVRFTKTEENKGKPHKNESDTQIDDEKKEQKRSAENLGATRSRNTKTLLSIFLEVVDLVFTGKLKKHQVSKSLHNYYSGKLISAVSQGYGELEDFDFNTPDYIAVQQLQNSQRVFAAHKSLKIIEALTSALTDENGKKLNKATFKKRALEIHDTWNKKWLDTEYNTSVASSQNARTWINAVNNKETLPNLTFLTMGDKNVRDSHRKLHGITLPVTHSFWNTHVPPLAFNCRCRISSVGSDATITKNNNIPEVPVPEQFKNNPGASGVIFNNTHSYFQNVSKTAKKNINKALKEGRESDNNDNN